MWNPEEKQSSAVYAFSGFIFEPTAGNLFHDGRLVELAPKVAHCLSYLVSNHGRLITKDELIDELWKDTFVEESALYYTISQLRKALATIVPETEFIKTVPRRGFRFVPHVETLKPGVVLPFVGEAAGNDDLSQTVEVRDKIGPISSSSLRLVEPEGTSLTTPHRQMLSANKRVAVAILGVAILAIASFAVWRSLSPSSTESIGSIAVLPFRSFSKTSDDRELRLRIADAVITRLGNLSHVLIRPTNSIVNFTDSSEDAVEIGRKLNVDAVLDGRLQTENGKLRATVQLILVRTGDQIWSAKFDGTSDRLIALQDQIAENLLARLIELQPRETKTELTKLSTSSAEAYDNYLRGRYFFDQRAVDFDDSLKKARGYFQAALEIDPTFTSATAELANVINLQTSSGTHKRNVGYPMARELALKALGENPDLPEAHLALGWVYQKYDHNFVEADRSFKRALELNPNHLLANLWLNINYALQGDLDSSQRHIERALAIDPANSTAHSEMVQLFIRRKEFDKALSYMPKVLDFVGDPARRALTQGEYEAMCLRFNTAIPLLESGARDIEARGLKPSRVYVVLGYAYAASGNREKALEAAARLEEMKGKRNVWSGLVATYAHLGETEKLHRTLDELYESGDERLLQMKVDPRYDIIRDDPKFQEILRKVNLL
ncbi:MAG: winged helix-turn-helix domain-containing protein [Acidobacteriota bacterium]|nr:MAG: winged helix-turn-helix domain-containing protein [Acidobacteriota bacterium]